MDVLLIDPPYVSLKGMPVDRGYNMGLTSLAAYLRREGYDTAVVMGDLLMDSGKGFLRSLIPGVNQNMNRYATGQREYERIVSDGAHPAWRKLAGMVERARPRAVGISYITPLKHSVARVARIVKEIDPGTTVITGGFHPTFRPEEVLRNPDIDVIVRGEGEIPLLALMKELEKDEPALENVPGINYRDAGGNIRENPPAGVIQNLDELPFPARDLVINCDYDTFRLHNVVTSRGCPYTCSFCADRRLWGSRVRRRSVSKVIEELEYLKANYKISYVDFVDGTFTFDRDYTRNFCNEIIERRLNIKWRCTARYDNLDADLLRLMKRSGCSGMYLGLESGSDTVLASIDKKFTVADIIRVSREVRASGIPVSTSVLLGLPGEKREDIAATLDLMRRVKTELFDINSYIPLPGTSLYDALGEADKEGIDWLKVGYKSFDNHFTTTIPREEAATYLGEAYRIADGIRRKTVLRLALKRLVGR